MLKFSWETWQLSENFEIKWISNLIPVGNYMFKVNNRNAITRCESCSKLLINTPERRHWRRFGVFILNFSHFTSCSRVSIVDFEKVNAGWEGK